MGKSVFKIRPKVMIIAAVIVILAVGLLYLLFFLIKAWVLIPQMDYLIREKNGTEITVSLGDFKGRKYYMDSIIFKGSRYKGELYLKNGESRKILYYPIGPADDFIILIDGVYGYYEFTNNQ